MITTEKIARISALTALARERELTEAEREERFALRQDYIAGFRQSLEGQLENVYLQNEDGTEEKLRKKGE